jgi:hypothetical protein
VRKIIAFLCHSILVFLDCASEKATKNEKEIKYKSDASIEKKYLFKERERYHIDVRKNIVP